MASGTYYPSVSGDDGGCTDGGAGFSVSGNAINFGDLNLYNQYTFIRFVNVTIPQGSTITSAFIRFTAYANQSGNTVRTNIYFHNYDDAAAPTSASGGYPDVLNAALTSGVAWDAMAAWSDGSQYDTVEIASILQDIIDRSGWDSGNAVVVQIRDDASDDYAVRQASAINWASGSEKAELHVEWAVNRYFSAAITAASQTANINLLGGQIESAITDVCALDDQITAAGGSQSVDLTDIVALDDQITAAGGSVFADLTDQAALDDNISIIGEYQQALTDIAGMHDFINGGLETNHYLTDVAGFDDSADCLNWSQWLRENQQLYVIRYFCTLTGAADDTDDLILPIQSFQATKRDGQQTYLSVIVPGFDYAQQVADRANGQLVIEMAYYVSGVEQLREEILRVDLENIRTDQGPKNRSITLSGHRTENFGEQTTTLSDPIYKYVSEGIRRFRFAIPDPWINPGDTVIVGEDSFRIGYINYIVSNRYRQMEVTEAS